MIGESEDPHPARNPPTQCRHRAVSGASPVPSGGRGSLKVGLTDRIITLNLRRMAASCSMPGRWVYGRLGKPRADRWSSIAPAATCRSSSTTSSNLLGSPTLTVDRTGVKHATEELFCLRGPMKQSLRLAISRPETCSPARFIPAGRCCTEIVAASEDRKC